MGGNGYLRKSLILKLGIYFVAIDDFVCVCVESLFLATNQTFAGDKMCFVLTIPSVHM